MDLNWNDIEMWGLTDNLHHETLVMWSGAASCAVGHYVIHSFGTSASIGCCFIMWVWLYCTFVKTLSVQLQFEPQFRITRVCSQFRTSLTLAQNVPFVFKIWLIKFTFGCDTILSEGCLACIWSVTKLHQGKCWRTALALPFETVAYREGGFGVFKPPPPKFWWYRWSPRSHKQEEPASRFPFVVHCVLIRL